MAAFMPRVRLSASLAGNRELSYSSVRMSGPHREPDLADQSRPFIVRGGGEAGELIRSIDWSSSVLGPPDTWPSALKTTLSIMLNSRHPMFLWWGPELIQFYNDAYVPSFGKGKHPRAMGQRGEECWPEIWTIISPQIYDVMERGIPSWNENQLVPIFRDGAIQDVYWTYGYSPVFDDDHRRVLGTLVVCQETTMQVLSRRDIERMSRESEAVRRRLTRLFDNAPAFVATLAGADHVFEIVNPLYQLLVGDNRHILGKSVAEALPEVVDQGFVTLLDRVFETGETYVGHETRVQLARTDDTKLEERFVTFIYQPRRDASDCVEGIDVFGFDVTEGVVAREAAQRATAESRALAESIPQQVWTSNSTGLFEFANNRVLEYFGVSKAELLRSGWTQFVHPDDLPRSLEAWNRALDTGALFEIEFRLRSRDGSYRWHLTRALPLRIEGRPIARWFGTNTDIDENKLLREKLRSQAEFEQHLLGIVSHDLRTPLNVIALGTTVLADQPSSSPVTAGVLLRIQSATRRAIRMVSDLLDFTQARLGGGLAVNPRAIRVSEVATAVIEELLTTHPDRSIQLETEGNDRGSWDPDRLTQLLVNLVSNAIHYGSPTDPISIAIRDEGDAIALEVANQGKPIPAELLPTLFLPMQRGTKSSTERSVGLGLFIVDEIAKGHGGSVSVRSDERTGTVFSVHLPRRASREAERALQPGAVQ